MAALTEEQVDFVAADIRAQGIRLQGLQDNLLDHVCILLEEGIDRGEDFAELYARLLPGFYRNELYELEEEALFLSSLKGPRLWVSRGWFFAALFGILALPYLSGLVLSGLHLLPRAYDAAPRVILDWTQMGCLWPLLTLGVIYFTPERYDPLVPRHARILLGGGALIRIV